MDKRKLITIAILLILWDRIEFLYYAFEGSDRKIGFFLIGDPIRLDSYVYFASIAFQQAITAIIIYMVIPIRAAKYFVIASLVCFVEYFLTYGQPIAKIPLPFDFYLPLSGSTLRLASICYLLWSCVFTKNGH